jgi:hypothetical protein
MSADDLETDPDRLTLREEWLQLCDEDVYGALILEQMIRWQTWVDNQEGREWIEKSSRDLSEDLGGIAGRTTCSKRLSSLEDMDILDSRVPDNPKDSKQWRVDFEALRARTIKAGYDYDAIHSDRVHETDTTRPGNGHDASTRRTRRVRETDRSIKTNNKDVHTSTSESAPACEDSEPAPDTTPDEPAADGGTEVEGESNDSDADLSAYERVFEIDEPSEFVEALAAYHDIDIARPGALWGQARRGAMRADDNPSEAELRDYLDAKLAQFAEDDRDFDSQVIVRFIRQDAPEWKEVLGDNDDDRRNRQNRERLPGQLDRDLGREDELDALFE